jgi:hypothetical protein
MSWKSYPKISQAPKLRSQVLKTMSWKPYPKISQVFFPGLPCPALAGSAGELNAELLCQTDRRTDGQTNERTQRGVAESASQITGAECHGYPLIASTN